MARRTGAPTILLVAKELCRLVTKFTPVLSTVYSGNAALLAALAAANAACAVLVQEITDVTVPGD